MLIARSQGVKDEACQRLLGFSSWEVREHTPVIHQLSCFNVPGAAPCCYGKACRFFHMLIIWRPILNGILRICHTRLSLFVQGLWNKLRLTKIWLNAGIFSTSASVK